MSEQQEKAENIFLFIKKSDLREGRSFFIDNRLDYCWKFIVNELVEVFVIVLPKLSL